MHVTASWCSRESLSASCRRLRHPPSLRSSTCGYAPSGTCRRALLGLLHSGLSSRALLVQVFNGKDDRWSVEQYVHWGVATFPAILARIYLCAGVWVQGADKPERSCARAGHHRAGVEVAGVAGAARRCGRHVWRGPCCEQRKRVQHAQHAVSARPVDTAEQACTRALARADWPPPPAQVPAGAGGLQQLRGVPLRSHGLLHPGACPLSPHRVPAPAAAGCPDLPGPAQAQLAASACQGCAAPSLDLCSAFASSRTVAAIAVRRPRLSAGAVLGRRARCRRA